MAVVPAAGARGGEGFLSCLSCLAVEDEEATKAGCREVARWVGDFPEEDTCSVLGAQGRPGGEACRSYQW